jgi:hypothetical protein
MAGKQVSSNQRFLGVDLGAETLKLVELARVDGQWLVQRRCRLEHGKEPQLLLNRLCREWDAATLAGAALPGRLGRQFRLSHVFNVEGHRNELHRCESPPFRSRPEGNEHACHAELRDIACQCRSGQTRAKFQARKRANFL